MKIYFTLVLFLAFSAAALSQVSFSKDRCSKSKPDLASLTESSEKSNLICLGIASSNINDSNVLPEEKSAKKDRGEIVADSLKSFPQKLQGDIPDIKKGDKKFLLAVAKDTWKFFENSVYSSSGFIPDKIFIKKKNAAHFTSITNIGLYLLCVHEAYKLKLITRNDAVNKIAATINSLKKLERYNGFFFNWYEFDIMKPSDRYISTVDSGWLYACLSLIADFYPVEFKKDCDELIKAADFKMLYDEKFKAFSLGYRVGEGLSNYHYSLLCSEARIAFYFAVLQKQLPAENWFYLNRTLDSTFEQHQKPSGNFKVYNNIKYFNGFYKYDGKIPVVPAWGGSVFEFMMPNLLVDERISKNGMGLNNRRVIEAHIDYALNKLKYPVWGLSPCSTPDGGYLEYGVPDLGSSKKNYGSGMISPHASVIALPYKPVAVISNLKEMIKKYPVYGEYGFYDCIKMDNGEVGDTYLALDQAMIFLAISNYLTDYQLPKAFMAKKEFKPLLEILKKDVFYN